MFSLKVIAACETEAQCALVRPKGVLATIDFGKKESITRRCLKQTQNSGVKFVIDTVGGDFFQQAMESIAPGGQIFSLGYSSGKIPIVTMKNLMQFQCSVGGVWLGGFARRFPKKFHEIIEKVIGMLDEQYFEPTIGAHFKFQQVNEALAHAREKKMIGKVIMTMRH
jgi:NADPH2:quinone reductase